MLDINNEAFENRVAARILEYFYRNAPWNRGLWGPGVRIQLLEVLESSEAVQARALHEAALHHFCGSVLPMAVNDPGIGDTRAKAIVQTASLESSCIEVQAISAWKWPHATSSKIISHAGLATCEGSQPQASNEQPCP